MEDVNHTAQSSQSVEDEPEDGGGTRAGVGRGSRRGVAEDHKSERSRDSFPLEEAEQVTIGVPGTDQHPEAWASLRAHSQGCLLV